MSQYSRSSVSKRPDRTLTIRCEYNRRFKKITFTSARNCSYDGLKQKIQQSFSLLQSFEIEWTDDDKEKLYISSDDTLTEAISFHDGGDGTSSSRSSIYSARSRRILIDVQILLHDDGPSLSDSSSLSSREEYDERNGSQYSFSLNGSVDGPVDDDARTVSSRDTGSAARSHKSGGMLRKLLDPASRSQGSSSQNRTQRPQQLRKSASQMFSLASRSRKEESQDDDAATELGTEPMASSSGRSTYSRTNEVSVYAQLKRQEVQQGPSIGPWLQEQESRVIKSMPIPVPSDADSFSLNTDTPFSDGEGPFADQISVGRNQRGEKRYTYRSSASDGSRGDEFEIHIQQGKLYRHRSHNHRPFSLDTRSSESGDQVSSGYPMSSQQSFRHYSTSDAPPPPASEAFTIPSELLIPDDVTDCSECGAILDSMRYICTTCGEKPAVPRAELEMMHYTVMTQSRDTLATECPPHAYEYPPMPHRNGGPSSSTSSDTLRTLMPGQGRLAPPDGHRHPRSKSDASSYMSTTSTLHPGYELCPTCVQTKGVNHSLLGDGNGSSPVSPRGLLPAQDLAVARRSAPSQKGQLRHAFAEKIWGTDGWQDLEQEFNGREVCSGCQAHMHKGKGRYKCVACDDFALCTACYSDVHNIHPRHAFIDMPDDPTYARSTADTSTYYADATADEPSLKHPNVVCYNCKQDIVGARFHCVNCVSSVDICSNCEVAGLHGDDGGDGHSSSHVLLKFPAPLAPSEEQAVIGAIASHEHGGINGASPGSVTESLAKTVLREKAAQFDPENHLISCNSCRKEIRGVRYQCLSCPSKPNSYNLCSDCEPWSWNVHDAMHIFIALPRPVDNAQPLQSATPLLPRDLYAYPAGPATKAHSTVDPDDYLRDLTHQFALCDRHMTKINGRWFRCAYCEESTDLCGVCHGYDTHDPTHAFIVLKAPINMKSFRVFANLDNQDNRSPAVLKGPIYYS
ncbi:unnamed protein product [Peniophora sp. CBMAI 1063]|nr:unnamed protein product [Peniophora sp. CBMAI 1063]